MNFLSLPLRPYLKIVSSATCKPEVLEVFEIWYLDFGKRSQKIRTMAGKQFRPYNEHKKTPDGQYLKRLLLSK